MADDPTPDVTTERLNQLYWNSSRTIDEIIGDLGVGRHTLYASIQPFEAGEACTSCGEMLFFTNRTHRASGTADCLVCGVAARLPEEERVGATSGAGDVMSGYDRSESGRRWTRWRDEVSAVTPERAALIGGAAALGMMVGAAATRALRDQ